MMTDASAGKKVFLGRVGENEARVVRFSVGKMLAAFPGATFTVLNRRPCDAAAYPVNDQYVSLAGDTVLWTIQSGDVTVAGTGECEIRAEKDGKILKSEIYMTATGPALDGSGTPPQPWESWVEQVKDDADRAEEAASKIIPIKDTVTDKSIANVPDACEGAVDALVLQLDPIQAGSGDPSPSNVRAISGRDSVVVYASGSDTSDPDEHTAQLHVTVYGGEVDWKQGKLKVTHKLVDIGTFDDWRLSGTVRFVHTFATGADAPKAISNSTNANAVCSQYAVTNRAHIEQDNNAFSIHNATDNYLTVVDSRFTDATAFAAAMSGVMLCYELATPVEYDLSSLPADITLVFGENNIWIDHGKVKSMTYPCDTKKYIDKKVSALQALILEH